LEKFGIKSGILPERIRRFYCLTLWNFYSTGEFKTGPEAKFRSPDFSTATVSFGTFLTLRKVQHKENLIVQNTIL